MQRTPPLAVGLFAALALILGGLACDDDASTKPKDVPDDSVAYAVASSPDSLLANVLTAYAERDPEGFAALLAEDYEFRFSDIDVQDPDVPSDDLDRMKEVLLHEKMLGSDYVQVLNLSFVYEPASVEYDEMASTPTDSVWTVLVTNFDLLVYGGTPMHPDEPEHYELEDGVEQFWFRKTGAFDPVSGEPLWEIARIKEHNFGGGGGKPAESKSWGAIKALFVVPPGGPPTYLSRGAPENLLENLKIAYEKRDAPAFWAQLAEDYEFIFSDIDQQDPDVPADPLDRSTEVGVHERMFDGDLVSILNLEFEFAPAALEADLGLSTPTDTLWTLLVTNVDLLLYGATPQHPNEPEALELEDGVAQFWFRKSDQLDPYSGELAWEIVRCKEHNFGGGGGKPTNGDTWGSIKALFR